MRESQRRSGGGKVHRLPRAAASSVSGAAPSAEAPGETAGEVAEEGTHQSLAQQPGGLYARLNNLQAAPNGPLSIQE